VRTKIRVCNVGIGGELESENKD